jgi:hypothetical protein
MIHRTPRLRALGEDVVLVTMPVLVLVVASPSAWLWLLAATGVVVLVFNVLTLHFPREIALDDDGIRFRAYGREHVYAWSACRLRVRRFLVRDRVLLRVEEVETGRSHRYWLTTHLSDFDALLRAINQRSAH